MKGVNALIVAAALGLCCAHDAWADTGLIAAHVPTGADPAIVIAVVKQALVNRDWTIEAVDADSVTAKLEGASNTSSIRIAIVNGQLIYEGSGVRTMRTGPMGSPLRTASDVPKNWLAYLRREIGTSLALLPEAR